MEMRFEYIDGVLVAHVQMFLDNAGAENFKYVLNERMKEGEKVILDLEKLITSTVTDSMRSLRWRRKRWKTTPSSNWQESVPICRSYWISPKFTGSLIFIPPSKRLWQAVRRQKHDLGVNAFPQRYKIYPHDSGSTAESGAR